MVLLRHYITLFIVITSITIKIILKYCKYNYFYKTIENHIFYIFMLFYNYFQINIGKHKFPIIFNRILFLFLFFDIYLFGCHVVVVLYFTNIPILNLYFLISYFYHLS